MAKSINGSGFKLYFPIEEEDTNTPPQATSSFGHASMNKPITETKRVTLGTYCAILGRNEPQDGRAAALESPSWQPDGLTRTQDTSGDTLTEVDKVQIPLRKHRSSLSIPPAETAFASEPDQEPNIRSFLDSRRRSSQVAEGP